MKKNLKIKFIKTKVKYINSKLTSYTTLKLLFTDSAKYRRKIKLKIQSENVVN